MGHEIRARLGLASSAMTKLDKIWKSNTISFPVKMKLYRSLVVSILLYGCESWTLTADTERRVQAFEHKCYRKLLRISYRDHKTNEHVRQQVTIHAGKQEPLLAIVKRRKLAWYGHVSRHSTLTKAILQGTVEGKRRRGRQCKAWIDNLKEWTNQPVAALLRMTDNRDQWRDLTTKSSMAPRRPSGHGIN